jgi:replicative DNA helicase
LQNLSNIDIEKAILSSIIYDAKLYEEIAAALKPNDFYHPFHINVFKAMEKLYKNDKPIDEYFLKEYLEHKKQFNENDFLEILSTNAIINTSAYIAQIKELSIKRELVHLSSEIKKLTIEEEHKSSDLMDEIEQKLYKITQDNISEDFKSSDVMIADTLEFIQEMKSRGNSKLIGLDTGFRALNDKTSGFGAGDLVIIAARPAMGKTALILNMVLKTVLRDEGAAVFSLEMPAEQLMLRMLSVHTSIPLQELRVGNLTDEQWSRLSAASDQLGKSKLFVDDDGYATIHHVRTKLRKLKSKHPEISVAVIDYLQLMTGEGSESRQQEISEVSRGLKLLARELSIPIIALSQLNRGLEARENKRPMLSDLRESGAIEQDADIILFVYRDDVYREAKEKEKEMKAKAEGKEYKNDFRKKEEEEAEIIIGKQRNGPTGTVNLVFQKRFTRFVDEDKATAPSIEIEYENIDTREGKIEVPPV